MNGRRPYSTYQIDFGAHYSGKHHSEQQDYRGSLPQNARVLQDRDYQGHRVSRSETSTSPEKRDLTKFSPRDDYQYPSGTRVMDGKTTDVTRSMQHTGTRESNSGNTLQAKVREPYSDDDSYRSTRVNQLHQPNNIRPEVPRRSKEGLDEQIKATIYGQCIGDAIGLLTEFMSKKDAHNHYSGFRGLRFSDKVHDRHRDRWDVGDWTDDSDHMILIMQSLTKMRGKGGNGYTGQEHVPLSVDTVKADAKDFAKRLYDWSKKGFEELNDRAGMGLGRTTLGILSQQSFISNPEETAKDVWMRRGGNDAPNGGVMRTSILGIHEWWDVEKVEKNAAIICQTTHYDPRCQASAVAVSVAISLMFQRQEQHFDDKRGTYKVEEIILDANQRASRYLNKDNERKELLQCMLCTDLGELKLDDEEKMGYTFKCLGAGFWALKQNDFQSAIEKLVMEGGDADTNCAVAGALLGCKLRSPKALPQKWLSDLANKVWLEKQIKGYIEVHHEMYMNALQQGGSRA